MPVDERLTSEIVEDDRSLTAALASIVAPAEALKLHRDDSSDGDSFYIVSYLEADGRKFTILFHLMLLYKSPCSLLALSVLDEDTLEYFSGEIRAELPQAENPFNIVMPTGGLSGTLNDLRVSGRATGAQNTPILEFELKLQAVGPTLPDLGVGVIPFSQGRDYEYGFPHMKTSGTLTVNSSSREVTGRSWFDREWGHFGPSKWTWMCIQLDQDGRQISLWDQQDNNDNPKSYVGGKRFATTLNQDGSLNVTSVAIKELSSWTTDDGKRTYANRWLVRIPGRAELTVKSLKDGQEIDSGQLPRVEGKCSVEGTYEGQDVKGDAFVELCDLFPFFAAVAR